MASLERLLISSVQCAWRQPYRVVAQGRLSLTTLPGANRSFFEWKDVYGTGKNKQPYGEGEILGFYAGDTDKNGFRDCDKKTPRNSNLLFRAPRSRDAQTKSPPREEVRQAFSKRTE